jgi:hypothetical protein
MTGITWRQIEKALQDYFGGVSNSGTGDFIAEIEAADFLDDLCDDCPATSIDINITDLAKHLADHFEQVR